MSLRRRIGVGFAGLIVVVVIFWVWVVDWLVLREIEERGSLALGARVELGSVDVLALPPGIELLRLQITDPSNPMTNAVEVRRIAGRMDGWALLSGQIVVDELAVEGIALGTPREVSGAIDGVAPPLSTGPMFTLPSFEPPSLETVLANETLESLALIQSVRGDVSALATRWRDKLEELPDEQAIEAYGERIKRLAEQGDVLEGINQLESLRRDIEQTLESIRDAVGALQREVGQLSSQIEAANRAPMADLNRLADRYALSPKGLSNLTRQLLGEPAQASVDQLLFWAEKLGFLMDGDESDVAQAEDAGPDVLIRLAKVSVVLESGEIAGEISNISTNQPALGHPTTALISSDSLPGMGRIELRAVLDHVKPEAPRDTISLSVTGYEVHGVALSESETWPVKLAAGRADLDASAELGAGDSLEARVHLVLRDARLEAPFPGTSFIDAAIVDAIKAVRELELTMTANGTTRDYELNIESNLDRILARAVGGILRRQTTRFREQLREHILEATRGPLSELSGQRRELDRLVGELGRREEIGEQQLAVKPSRLPGLGDKLKKLF